MHVHARRALPVLLLHNLDPRWEPAEIEEALSDVGCLEEALGESGHLVLTAPVKSADLDAVLKAHDPQGVLVFNWCEELPGIPRSEARVAETLEAHGFVYTGSPGHVLELSWDKRRVKQRLQLHGIPTPAWRTFESPAVDGWSKFPAIVKPALEHCSLGLTPEAVVLTRDELKRRIEYVLQTFEQPALVEDFIDGREFHVTVWGNGTLQVLPPAEMDFSAFVDVHDRLCTFDSKFRPGSLHYEQIQVRVPAPISASEQVCMEETVMAAYKVMGCRDYARLDLRLRDGTFYVLDVNPNADISPEASVAFAAEAAGLSYGAMLSHIVEIAAERHTFYNR